MLWSNDKTRDILVKLTEEVHKDLIGFLKERKNRKRQRR